MLHEQSLNTVPIQDLPLNMPIAMAASCHNTVRLPGVSQRTWANRLP
jgi:hypothetical protein